MTCLKKISGSFSLNKSRDLNSLNKSMLTCLSLKQVRFLVLTWIRGHFRVIIFLNKSVAFFDLNTDEDRHSTTFATDLEKIFNKTAHQHDGGERSSLETVKKASWKVKLNNQTNITCTDALGSFLSLFQTPGHSGAKHMRIKVNAVVHRFAAIFGVILHRSQSSLDPILILSYLPSMKVFDCCVKASKSMLPEDHFHGLSRWGCVVPAGAAQMLNYGGRCRRYSLRRQACKTDKNSNFGENN